MGTTLSSKQTGFRPRARWNLVFLLLALGLAVAFFASIALGSVPIPLADVLRTLSGRGAARTAWETIIWDFRIPKAITAMLASAALGVSGLQMQTLFRNPLADPYILGISSGASLGVALVVLASGSIGVTLLPGAPAVLQGLGIVGAATLGAALVFWIVMLAAQRVRSLTTLLVLGLMVGYLTGAFVSILIYLSVPERVQAYLSWTFGSFGGVTWSQLRLFAPTIVAGLLIAQLSAKPLNALLLGEDYALSMGLHLQRTRGGVIFATSLLAGVTTAFCGPIGFLGIAVPHLARHALSTADHRVLFPAVALLGAILGLTCDLIAQVPGGGFILPLNAVTALFGAPIVIWVITRGQPN